ncbi:hypothetical protein NP493_1338g00039 [Ridgeia piscesae]|uniref:Uncharacterized protein n=1 Tax=Ridgeia piscesae TaxID=27915 RepID=A0AAD9NDA8_RIDPI|nr:hypothetical protein NP493_1338g00039 [Ridgeia piscesae]
MIPMPLYWSLVAKHICHARQISPVSAAVDPDICSSRTRLCSESNTSCSTEVPIDPDACFTKTMSDRCQELHIDFNDAFDIKPSLYNGARGKTQAFVDMGPTLPPQRKGRLPQYYRSIVNELKDKFDDLESAGFIAIPELVTLLPCEVDAVQMGVANKHFAPFIIQSSHATEILTDNCPDIQETHTR